MSKVPVSTYASASAPTEGEHKLQEEAVLQEEAHLPQANWRDPILMRVGLTSVPAKECQERAGIKRESWYQVPLKSSD